MEPPLTLLDNMQAATQSLPSTHRDRMAIDSLLNPSDGRLDTQLPLPYRSQTQSPQCPLSPSHYYFPQFHDRHPYSEKAITSHEQAYLPYELRSMNSSPSPYSRDRYGSVSSSSSTPPEHRRPPRPKYEEEEMYFIWYHRVDLCQEWKAVRESFNRQFPHRQRKGFQGIQCKFYRFIREKNCPTLREQRRMRDSDFLRDGVSIPDSPKYGVVEWARVWYPWMRENKEQVLRRWSTWLDLWFQNILFSFIPFFLFIPYIYTTHFPSFFLIWPIRFKVCVFKCTFSYIRRIDLWSIDFACNIERYLDLFVVYYYHLFLSWQLLFSLPFLLLHYMISFA